MATKPYVTPSVDIMIGGGDGGDVTITGSGQSPLNPVNPTNTPYELWLNEYAANSADKSYEGYVKWMVENGYADFIHPES